MSALVLVQAPALEVHFERISWCLPKIMTPFEKNIPKYITVRSPPTSTLMYITVRACSPPLLVHHSAMRRPC